MEQLQNKANNLFIWMHAVSILVIVILPCNFAFPSFWKEVFSGFWILGFCLCFYSTSSETMSFHGLGLLVNCHSHPCPPYVMCAFLWLPWVLLYLWFSAVWWRCLRCGLCVWIYPVWGSLLLESADFSFQTKFRMSLHIIFFKKSSLIAGSSAIQLCIC